MENSCDDKREWAEQMLKETEADKEAALKELQKALEHATRFLPKQKKRRTKKS